MTVEEMDNDEMTVQINKGITKIKSYQNDLFMIMSNDTIFA